jgi:hypothetical protein
MHNQKQHGDQHGFLAIPEKWEDMEDCGLGRRRGGSEVTMATSGDINLILPSCCATQSETSLKLARRALIIGCPHFAPLNASWQL